MSTALDFRDIHQHPPAASKAGQPLPPDPSWDAHKVYFNERERSVAPHGDEFDDFFAKTQDGDNVFVAPFDSDKQPNETDTAKEEKDETLDPLGWPVDAFRSMSGRVQSLLVANNNNNNNTANHLEVDDDDDDDGEGDDLNLLRKSDQEDDATPSTAATLLSSLGIASDTRSAQQMVDGVQNLFLYGSSTTTTTTSSTEPSSPEDEDEETMDKQARIKMYETTGADDESSVEEDEANEDDDEWEKDRDVGYVAQSGSNDEDEVLLSSSPSPPPLPQRVSNTEPVTVPEFQPVKESAVPTFKIPAATATNKKKKKKSGNSKSVPMLRPPPPEKLQKWEEEKARPLKHLQETKK